MLHGLQLALPRACQGLAISQDDLAFTGFWMGLRRTLVGHRIAWRAGSCLNVWDTNILAKGPCFNSTTHCCASSMPAIMASPKLWAGW